MAKPLPLPPHPPADVEERQRTISSLLELRSRIRRAMARRPDRSDLRPAPIEPGETDALVGFIGGEIIPRLMLAHRMEPGVTGAAPSGVPAPDPEVGDRFLALVLDGTEDETLRFVDDLRARGVPMEAILLDLMADTARRLGELWETDDRSFSEITLGLLRLHRVLREQRLEGDVPETAIPGDRATVLLATACGDQHYFGVLMVSQFFRKAGWWVLTEPGTHPVEIDEILQQDSIDLVGLSASCDVTAAGIAAEIERYRAASCNPALKVMVGGRLFLESPELIARVGADAAAFHPHEAVRTADALVSRVAVGC